MDTQPLPPPSVETSLALINERLERIESRPEPKLKASDILTAATVAISVLVAWTSWSKDRDLVRREQAQQIRSRMATAMGKLDTCKFLTMSIFDDSELIFEKAKMSLHKLQQSNKLTSSNIIVVRNESFSSLLKMRNDIEHKMNEIQIDTGYIDISGHQNCRTLYRQAIQRLKMSEESAFWDIQNFTEDAILDIIDDPSKFSDGNFWKLLRAKNIEAQSATLKTVENIVGNVNHELEAIIDSSDDTLVKTGN